MVVNLICSDNIRRLLEDICREHNIIINPSAKVCIVEKGFELDDGKTGIIFDMISFDSFLELIEILSPKKKDKQDIVTVKAENGEYKIAEYTDIRYFEALGKDVYCAVGKNKYKVSEKLYNLEEKLKRSGFIRVSKSFIVNIKAIERIVPWFNSTLILKMGENDSDITVTRSYLNEFKRFLDI